MIFTACFLDKAPAKAEQLKAEAASEAPAPEQAAIDSKPAVPTEEPAAEAAPAAAEWYLAVIICNLAQSKQILEQSAQIVLRACLHRVMSIPFLEFADVT